MRHLADRLQDLLGSGNGAKAGQATPAAAGSSDSLQSVLDRLQSTLQQRLQSYGTATPAASSSTSLTA